MIHCADRGEIVGSGIRKCCGGRETIEPLYVCMSQKEPAEYCLVAPGHKSLVSIALNGDASKMAHVAFCNDCIHRNND